MEVMLYYRKCKRYSNSSTFKKKLFTVIIHLFSHLVTLLNSIVCYSDILALIAQMNFKRLSKAIQICNL